MLARHSYPPVAAANGSLCTTSDEESHTNGTPSPEKQGVRAEWRATDHTRRHAEAPEHAKNAKQSHPKNGNINGIQQQMEELDIRASSPSTSSKHLPSPSTTDATECSVEAADPEADSGEAFHNVFINNLAPNVTADELREVFEPYGEVTSVVVMKDEAGNSRRFGFVNFLHAEDAARAVAGVQGFDGHGTVWNVAPALNKRSQQAGSVTLHHSQAGMVSEDKINRNLYIRNLCTDVDEDMLQATFSEYGAVESVRVLRDVHGNSRSVGFVQYFELEAALAALKGMNGRQMGTKTIYVQVARHHLEEAKKSSMHADRPESAFMLPGITPPIMPHPYMMYGGSGYASSPMMMPGSGMMYMGPWGSGVPSGMAPPMPPTDINAVVDALACAETPEHRDNVLGEALFPLVQSLAVDPGAVPKITGMLLELQDQDVIKMLEDHEFLHYRVWSAQRTLFAAPPAPAAHVPLGMYGRSVSADATAPQWPYAAPLQPPPRGHFASTLHRTGSNPIATMVAGVLPGYGAPPFAPAAPVMINPEAAGAMPIYRSVSAGSGQPMHHRRRRAQRASIAE